MLPEDIARLLRLFGEAESKGLHELGKKYFEQAIQKAAEKGLLKEMAKHIGKEAMMKLAPQVAKELGLDAAEEALFTGIAESGGGALAAGGSAEAGGALLFGLTAPELALAAGVVAIAILIFAGACYLGSYIGHIMNQRAAWQRPGASILRGKITEVAGKTEPDWRQIVRPGRLG